MKNFTSKTALLLTALFLSGIGISNAQNTDKPTKDGYLSYFGNDSTNINITSYPCEGFDIWFTMSCVIYSEDTIRINGNLYVFRAPQGSVPPTDPNINYYFPLSDTLFLREDKTTGRLYRYYRDYFGAGETEKLVCDMSLEVGDVFISPGCYGESQYTVIDVNYTNGIKTILLSNSWFNTIFKEGVFPDRFPLYQEPGVWDDIFESHLECQHKDGIQVYVGYYGCYGPQPWLTEETENKTVSVFPSVINHSDVLTITSSSSIKSVIIYNIMGRTEKFISTIEDDKTWQVRMNYGVPQGVYFIVIQTDNGIYYEKILICM